MEILYSPLERKIALLRLGVAYRTIAERVGCDRSTVANVVAGRPNYVDGGGLVAVKVRREVARALKLPVGIVFPEYADHITKKAAS